MNSNFILKDFVSLISLLFSYREQSISERAEHQKTLNFMSKELEQKTEQIKKRILEITEEVDLQVGEITYWVHNLS